MPDGMLVSFYKGGVHWTPVSRCSGTGSPGGTGVQTAWVRSAQAVLVGTFRRFHSARSGRQTVADVLVPGRRLLGECPLDIERVI